jgi:CubicO group peptidase (beta-lactamase class C family)
MISKRTLTMFMTLCLATALCAGETNAFAFPQTEQGRMVAAYFSAFAAPAEDVMQAFLRDHLSSDALRRDPLEQRLARYRSFKEQARTLRPERMLPPEENAINLLARDGRGQWLEFSFSFEAAGEGKVTAIRAAPVDAENVADYSAPPLARAQLAARLRALLDERSKADLFSGVVLLAHEGQVVFHEACGLASVEYGAANRPDTRFNLGSINKLFTRVAVGQLIERKKLSLDDPIAKFLPDYPNRQAAEKVTVRHLLDMTSGIGDFFGQKFNETPKDRLRELADYLPLFASQPLQFQPGSGRRYSNGGYVVLGLIIEKASGLSYGDYVREHIYLPAAMEATAHLDADVPNPNVASGYTRNWDWNDHDGQPWRANLYTRPARGSSAGGGYSTAMDLYRFAQALKAGKLLGALGKEWFDGPQAFAGGAPGINAELDMDVVPGWTIVVLSNYDPPAANQVAQKIAIMLKFLR